MNPPEKDCSAEIIEQKFFYEKETLRVWQKIMHMKKGTASGVCCLAKVTSSNQLTLL